MNTDKESKHVPIEDALQNEVNTLQARIDELDSEVSEEYMLRVMWEERHDTLRQSISDAVGEIEIVWFVGLSPVGIFNLDEAYETAAGNCLDILRKHGLVKE